MLDGPVGRTIKLGVRSLLLHKLRSALTAVGILFGVCAVIAMLAFAEGVSYENQKQIRELGSNKIVVESRKPPQLEGSQQTGGGSMMGTAEVYGLTYDDADAIAATLPKVSIVIPVRSVPKLARNGEYAMNVQVWGTVPQFSGSTGLILKEGRFLERRDLELKSNVCVLGASVANRLFRFEDALGKGVRIGTESFRVVGVLDRADSSQASKSATLAADAILVPLSAARAIFGEITVKQSGTTREIEQVELHQMQIEVEGDEVTLTDNVLGTAAALRKLMKQLHKRDDYAIVVPVELLKQAEESARMFSILLGVIAGISLLVGGIGIMNVMLATVTERTREIGIRRALGAKRRHIVSQFLVETVVLSCGGGLVGVALGALSPYLIEYLTEYKTRTLWEFVVLAFGVSAAVGVVFGIYPAWRAAQMDPVEALRHE